MVLMLIAIGMIKRANYMDSIFEKKNKEWSDASIIRYVTLSGIDDSTNY